MLMIQQINVDIASCPDAGVEGCVGRLMGNPLNLRLATCQWVQKGIFLNEGVFPRLIQCVFIFSRASW